MNFVLAFIFIQTIVFGIVIMLLRRMMYSDTESAVNRLNQSYLEINKKKEELSSKIQQIEKEYQKRKDEAEKIALEIKEKTETELYAKRESILTKAKEEGERIISEAMGMKEVIRQTIRKEELMKLLDFCDKILGEMYTDVVTKEIDELLAQHFMQEVEAVDMSHVPETVNEIHVVTVHGASPEVVARLKETIEKKIKRPVTVSSETDPKIIGGVVIKFGSLQLDGSIAGRLKERIETHKQKTEEST